MREAKVKKGLSTKGFVGPVIIEILVVAVIAILNSVFNMIPAIKQTEYLAMIISSIIVLIGFRMVFRSSFKGNLKLEDHSFDVFLPFAVVLGLDIVLSCVWGDVSFSRLTLKTILLAATAGISEEVMNRVFPVALMLRNKLSEKNLWPIMIVSSVIFGLVHFGNVACGASVCNSCFQVFSAFCMGLLFCAMYMRSGSILLPMILHGIHDFICFLDVSGVNEKGIITQQFDIQSVLVGVILDVVLVALAIYLMRPSKRAAVVEIWKEKWSM